MFKNHVLGNNNADIHAANEKRLRKQKSDWLRRESELLNNFESEMTIQERLPEIYQSNKTAQMEDVVLRFYVYFQEAVHELPGENYRVRKCVLYWYCKDGSLQVIEPKTDNSGVLQGEFLKRAVRAKADGSPYYLSDLTIGSSVTLVGRTFYVVDVDAATRNYYLEKRKITLDKPKEYPLDPFEENKKKVQSKKNVQGIASTKRPETLGKFLECDRKVLRFYCTWKDTSFGGQALHYLLHFFLVDDTIELREVSTRNSGRDPFPLLLRREKVPKSNGQCVNAYDLSCGTTLHVYGRNLVLYDCDAFTKQYYQTEFNIEQHIEPLQSGRHHHHIPIPYPPYNGFGSEEDSIRSCQSLVPKPAKSDFKNNYSNQMLRFHAKILHPSTKSDANRSFVVSYSMSNGTSGVYEPPERNSGIIGGKYLEMNKYNTIENSQPRRLQQSDFTIGSTIQFCNPGTNVSLQTFKLLSSDEFTQKLLTILSATSISDTLPSLSQSKPNLSQSKPNLSQSKPNLSQSEPNLSQSEPSLSQSKPKLSQSKPNVSKEQLPTVLEYSKHIEMKCNTKTDTDILRETLQRFISFYFQHKRVVYQKCFSFDTLRSGYISKMNLTKVLRTINGDISEKDLQLLLQMQSDPLPYETFLTNAFGRKLTCPLKRT